MLKSWVWVLAILRRSITLSFKTVMSRKHILLVYFGALVLAGLCAGQNLIPPNAFLPGWRQANPLRRFVGQDLFNCINGGAELFHEFGFSELLVQKYTNDQHELSLDLYRMTSPESALGIYLIKMGTEVPIKGISVRHTANRYQIQAVKDCYFIQVQNLNGERDVVPVMAELLRQTVLGISAESPVTLLDRLPSKGLIAGSERLIRGMYGLQSLYTLGDGDMLKLGGKVFGVAGNYQDSNGRVFTRLIIIYPDSDDAADAFSYMLAHFDSYLRVLKKNQSGVLFQDYRNEYGIVLRSNNKLEITLRLGYRPSFPE